jgi:HSP20 family molecular chaperone IbpA
MCCGEIAMVKLSEEVAKALMAAKGEAVVVDVPGIDDDFVIVQRSMFVAAMAALEHQRNVELIREGIADMEAGRTIPLDEAMDRIRNALLLRKDNESLR